LGALPVGTARRPAVVELFTSEGCSSCPPAEAYLGELGQRPDVLALALHVDYWDDLGWRDRFSLSDATSRQKAYAASLKLPSPYTPQMVIDGQADFVGSDRRSIDRTLDAARTGVTVRLALHDGLVLAQIDAQAQAGSSDVLLVAYRREAVSAIGRGENAGRTLTESNIVRGLRPLGRYTGSAQTYTASVAALPVDATDIAVLVQAPGQGRIIGAATRTVR
jgi:hypothetical protein